MKLTAYRRWKEEREEEERQLVLLALAVLSIENPGFDFACNEIAVQFDNVEAGRALMYDAFRELRAKRQPYKPCPRCGDDGSDCCICGAGGVEKVSCDTTTGDIL